MTNSLVQLPAKGETTADEVSTTPIKSQRKSPESVAIPDSWSSSQLEFQSVGVPVNWSSSQLESSQLDFQSVGVPINQLESSQLESSQLKFQSVGVQSVGVPVQ